MPPPSNVLNSYRESYEPEEQWKLRKSFLERNWDSFPPERRTRLLALAQCFQNIHILGCSYPPRVMDEVTRHSVGLVEKKPKQKKLPFTKIHFVKATPLGAVSALDVEDEDLDEEQPDGMDEVDNLTSNNQQMIRRNSSEDEEIERPSFGRSGLGFGASNQYLDSHNKEGISQSGGSSEEPRGLSSSKKLVFGKPDYAQKMGFIKGQTQTSTDGKFQFGVPFKGGLDSSKAAGEFVFGNKESNTVASCTDNTFQFGVRNKDYAGKLGFVKGNGERRRSADDLSSHMESTSIGEGPLRKSPKLETSGFDRQLEHLNELRTQLRRIRPSLHNARVEYAMLQVNMAVRASQSKIEWQRGERTIMKMYGIQIATGADETSAYRDFIAKVFDNQPWKIMNGTTGPTLAIGMETAIPCELPQTNHEFITRNEPTTSNSRITIPLENSRIVNGQIIRNLMEVRNTIWTPNFKSKVAMFGGPSSDIQSTLNMVFQMAKLRPIRDAIVPSPFLRPEYSTVNQAVMCVLVFHGVVLAEATARSKTDAKLGASKKLYEILQSRSKFEITERNGRHWLKTSGCSQQDHRAQITPEWRPILPNTPVRPEYKDLFLIRPADTFKLHDLMMMFASANSLALEYETDAMLKQGVTVQVCRLKLATEPALLFEGFGETKQTAKAACIRTTLEQLLRNCFTICIKQSIVDGAQEFNRETMPLGMESQAVQEGLGRQLDGDNVGYRLLQNMGWRGGGLGQGTGVVEPVMLKDNMGGRGLGYEGSGAISKRFKSHVASTLRVFLRETDVFDELKFSPSFSNAERKEIHSIASRLGLKSKSKNRPEGRVLCVSHNIDWKMIFNHLKQTGSSGKYELLPPNTWTLPDC